MAATAEAYGFGARAPFATPRATDYEMKERVRLSGLFPRVRNEPMSKQLQVLLKEFEQNAALTGILERRRRLDERTHYELQVSRRDGRCRAERSGGRANCPRSGGRANRRSRRSPAQTSAQTSARRGSREDGRRSRQSRRGREQRQRRSAHAASRAWHSCAGPKPEPPRQRKPLSKRVVGTRGDRWH